MDSTINLFNMVKSTNGGTLGEHKRFIVSITNNTIKNFFSLSFIQFREITKRLNNTAKDLNLLNYCFGFWKNDNVLYLDLNLSTDNKRKALILARFFNQKAIYDSGLNKEIFLRGVKK